jgi:hypothetical protein
MKAEPVDKYFGIPLSEWIEKIPNELEMDAVGFWQIVPVGKDNFDLEGDALKDFARRSIVALIKRGAIPVRPSCEKDKFWEAQFQYGILPEEIADSIIVEWLSSGEDPNEDGLWFALLD